MFYFFTVYCCFCIYYCLVCFVFFFFKQKTAYEMRISDWSSDVCSSDLLLRTLAAAARSDLRRSSVPIPVLRMMIFPSSTIPRWHVRFNEARLTALDRCEGVSRAGGLLCLYFT